MSNEPAKIDPQMIFEQGERFFATLLHLHQSKNAEQLNLIGIPVCVLSAFASELYLKSIRCSELGSPTRSHLLLDLFNDLSPTSQKVIEEYWNTQATSRKEILDKLDISTGKTNPRDLRSNLAMGSDGFRLIRYVYEGGADFTFNLGDLPLVLRKAIAQLHPEWLARPASFVNNPHAVFVKGKNNPPHFSMTLRGEVDSKTTTFQWAIGNTPDGNDGSSR